MTGGVSDLKIMSGWICLRKPFGDKRPRHPAADSDEGLGLTTWLVFDKPFGLNLLNFKPGIRFSYLDPSSFLADDQLQEITVGIRYDAPVALPITFMVDYTVLTEEASRSLANDRLVAMFQITY